jgi:hypothetical protein
LGTKVPEFQKLGDQSSRISGEGVDGQRKNDSNVTAVREVLENVDEIFPVLVLGIKVSYFKLHFVRFECFLETAKPNETEGSQERPACPSPKLQNK